MVLACIPPFFFPKHLPKYYLEKHKALKNADRTTKNEISIIKQLKCTYNTSISPEQSKQRQIRSY